MKVIIQAECAWVLTHPVPAPNVTVHTGMELHSTSMFGAKNNHNVNQFDSLQLLNSTRADTNAVSTSWHLERHLQKTCFGVDASQVGFSWKFKCNCNCADPRMTGGLDPLMLKYNASILYDKLLYKEDILGSIAFARANAKSGILSNNEFTEIERGLREVQKEWETDTFVIMPNDEDIHTANERRLSEIIGKDIAGKLHTGRSRNEQVVCDMRLWLRNRIQEIESHLVAFIKVIAARAEAEV